MLSADLPPGRKDDFLDGYIFGRTSWAYAHRPYRQAQSPHYPRTAIVYAVRKEDKPLGLGEGFSKLRQGPV
jgi:hypothetical protein